MMRNVSWLVVGDRERDWDHYLMMCVRDHMMGTLAVLYLLIVSLLALYGSAVFYNHFVFQES